MDTTRNATHDGENRCARESDRALPTIIRGEEVLEEAREVAQKISGRVCRAITERTPPDDSREIASPAGLS